MTSWKPHDLDLVSRQASGHHRRRVSWLKGLEGSCRRNRGTGRLRTHNMSGSTILVGPMLQRSGYLFVFYKSLQTLRFKNFDPKSISSDLVFCFSQFFSSFSRWIQHPATHPAVSMILYVTCSDKFYISWYVLI